MELINHNINKLTEIQHLLRSLPNALFTESQSTLSQATIGQHFRHIIEFYICLENGMKQDSICYDDRKRDIRIETNQNYAIGIINEIIGFLGEVSEDKPMTLWVNYGSKSEDKTALPSSLFRELAYALDHAIHHMAIVKIALIGEDVELGSDFGVAPSTIRYHKACAQ